jgi:outer membrane protein TolC
MTPRSRMRQGFRLGTAAIVAALVAGCASFSPDGGMDAVGRVAAADVGLDPIKITDDATANDAHDRVARLLKSPLSAATAVQVALLSNKGLQAAYNELGVSEALFVAATLPPSPRLTATPLTGVSFLEVDASVTADVIALLTLPARADIAEGRFRQAQLRAAEATLRLATETRRAYYRAVADTALVGVLDRARLTAEIASELARKLGETGALSKLDQAREHAFYADLSAQLAQARLRQRTDRERLTRLMGLWGGEIAYRLPASLPALPRQPRTMMAIEVAALERRVDLRIAAIEMEGLAKRLGLTQATRFVTTLELGGAGKYERTASETIRGRGLEAQLQIPIFDLGESRLRDAQEQYMQAVNRLAEKAVNIRSQARAAYQLYRGSYDVARHYQAQVLPLRQIVADEAQLRYNGMLTDLFQLLVDTRAQIDSNVAAIDAQRDFFIAAADLSAAIAGGGEGDTGASAASARTVSSNTSTSSD